MKLIIYGPGEYPTSVLEIPTVVGRVPVGGGSLPVGLPGQVLSFDAQGVVIAVEPPSMKLSSENW